MQPTAPIPQSAKSVTYGDIARLFLRMSVQAFGGPVAHIAMGQDEIVQRRGWLTREEYLDIVSATNLIPGPNSTEVMIHVGHRLRGISGAIVAGASFITPAFLITLVLSILYVQYGTLPQIASMLWGIQPVILVIILVAAYRLAPAALKSRTLWALFAVALLILLFTPVPEVIVMVGAGLLYALVKTGMPNLAIIALLPLSAPAAQVVNLGETSRAGLFDLFFYFLRIGSVLFGSGYVLISYIQDDLVNAFGWLSNRELLDAVAIGQLTPGPVLTTVTTVGYIVAGLPGAVVGTIGVFLPSFVLVILTAPLLPRMRRSPFLSAFLNGANAGVIAAIVVTVLRLATEALRPTFAPALAIGGISLLALLLAAVSWVALIRFKLNATYLILLGAGVGLLVGLAG